MILNGSYDTSYFDIRRDMRVFAGTLFGFMMMVSKKLGIVIYFILLVFYLIIEYSLMHNIDLNLRNFIYDIHHYIAGAALLIIAGILYQKKRQILITLITSMYTLSEFGIWAQETIRAKELGIDINLRSVYWFQKYLIDATYIHVFILTLNLLILIELALLLRISVLRPNTALHQSRRRCLS